MTLEPDVEQLLRDAMRRNGSSFKQTLNDAVRHGLLSLSSNQRPKKPFKVKAQNMGLKAGIDPSSLNRLVDELEMDAVLENQRRDE